MSQEEFDELYKFYAVNDSTLSDLEYMKTHDGFNGEFVYDMWRMLKFVKSNPILAAVMETGKSTAPDA